MTGHGRRSRVAVVLVAVAGPVAAGCGESSRVDPDAPVAITGSVRAPDGSPLADRPVRLGGGVGTDEGAFAVLTLGLACTTGACTGRVADTTTVADGTYRFDLTGRDTQSTFGQAVTQLVSVSAAPGPGQVSGAAASARFRVQVGDVRVPTLDLVDPALTVEGPGDVVASWSTARPGPYEVTFEEATTVPVWQVTTGSGPAIVDPRVLEDSEGRVVVSGGSTDRVEGSDVVLRWRSPGVPYAAGAGPPPSRGRPCRVVDESGGAAPVETDCPVTDGDLTAAEAVASVCPPGPEGTSGPACRRPVAMVVELAAPVPAELVVVRGCEGGCAVDVSADGSAFQPAGAVSAGFGTVALDGRPVAAVRVGLGSGSGLREVSVWGGRPGTAGLRSLDDPPGDLREAFSADGSGDDDGIPPGLAVVAVAVAGLALAGTGYVVGRRRR